MSFEPPPVGTVTVRVDVYYKSPLTPEELNLVAEAVSAQIDEQIFDIDTDSGTIQVTVSA